MQGFFTYIWFVFKFNIYDFWMQPVYPCQKVWQHILKNNCLISIWLMWVLKEKKIERVPYQVYESFLLSYKSNLEEINGGSNQFHLPKWWTCAYTFWLQMQRCESKVKLRNKLLNYFWSLSFWIKMITKFEPWMYLS